MLWYLDKAEHVKALIKWDFIPTLSEPGPLSFFVLVHSYFSPKFAASVNFDSSPNCLTLSTPTFHSTLSLIRSRFRANYTYRVLGNFLL